MSTPRSEKDAPYRWAQWQQSLVSHALLPPDGQQREYTMLRVRPSLRPGFFAVLDLLSARVHFEDRLLRLLEEPARGQTLSDAQAAWTAWQTWTRRLAAYLDRVASGRAGTLPPAPDALTTLLPDLEVLDAESSSSH